MQKMLQFLPSGSRVGVVLTIGLVLTLAVASSASAAGEVFAPLDRSGPDLTIPVEKLRQSLECSSDLVGANREPVLLTPATTVNSDQNYSWNYEKALKARGIPYCTSDVPGVGNKNMFDMQTRAEYVVYAIREMRRTAGRKISVMGHSQGGQIMRWPLRFWPDTRQMVEEVIGLAATNHGSTVVRLSMCSSPCAESLQQQRDDSNWYKALNSHQETFAGIDYTQIYSRSDQFVQPNLDSNGSSSVHGPGRITNVALQDVCPNNTTEHLGIGTIDATASALAFDALTHDGPASPERIDRSVCARPLAEGVDPVTGPARFAAESAQVADQLNTAPKVSREPPLRCYVFANCASRFAAAPCPNARGRVSATRFGPVALGRGRASIRAELGPGRRTRGNLDRWCLPGGDTLSVVYSTKRLPRSMQHRVRRKVAFVSSTSRRFAFKGVRVGSSARTARRRLHRERRVRVGRSAWYLAVSRTGTTVLVRTRRGKVRTVGLAAPAVVKSPRTFRGVLCRFRL